MSIAMDPPLTACPFCNQSPRELAAAKAENERLRAALQELVALKAMKDQDWMDRYTRTEYAKRKPLAWEAARRALSGEGE